MADVWLDAPSGAQPSFSIFGLLGNGTGEPYGAHLLFGVGEAVASFAVLATGDQPTT